MQQHYTPQHQHPHPHPHQHQHQYQGLSSTAPVTMNVTLLVPSGVPRILPTLLAPTPTSGHRSPTTTTTPAATAGQAQHHLTSQHHRHHHQHLQQQQQQLVPGSAPLPSSAEPKRMPGLSMGTGLGLASLGASLGTDFNSSVGSLTSYFGSPSSAAVAAAAGGGAATATIIGSSSTVGFGGRCREYYESKDLDVAMGAMDSVVQSKYRTYVEARGQQQHADAK
jgi:hypothetical protein